MRVGLHVGKTRSPNILKGIRSRIFRMQTTKIFLLALTISAVSGANIDDQLKLKSDRELEELLRRNEKQRGDLLRNDATARRASSLREALQRLASSDKNGTDSRLQANSGKIPNTDYESVVKSLINEEINSEEIDEKNETTNETFTEEMSRTQPGVRVSNDQDYHMVGGQSPTDERNNQTQDENVEGNKPALVKDLLNSVKEKILAQDEKAKIMQNRLFDGQVEAGIIIDLPESYRLKNIRSLITPKLLSILARAGHGDKIVFAASGLPSESLAANPDNVVRLDGLGMLPILTEVMKLLPVCKMDQFPLLLMKPSQPDQPDPKIWTRYKDIVESAEQHEYQWAKLDREKFYAEARKAFAIVQTGEPDCASSLIITKGLVKLPLNDLAKNKTLKYQDLNNLRSQLLSLGQA